MAYLGRSPLFGKFEKLDDISSQFNGTKTDFNLLVNGSSTFVGTPEQLIISLNGTVLEPVVAFTISSGANKIIFTTAPTLGQTFWGIKLGDVLDLPTVADNSVSELKLTTNSVSTAKIFNSAVTTDKILDGAVTTGKLATNAVTGVKITDGTITTAKLTDSIITTVKIADGNVTTAKLGTGSVTNSKITATTATPLTLSTGSTSIDMTTNVWQKITATGNFTLTFSSTSGKVESILLECVNFGTRTITWTSVRWNSGTVPTFTTTGTDHVVIYKDSANILYGMLVNRDVR